MDPIKDLKPYIHVWPLFYLAQFLNPAFTYKKAFICAAFSRSAYWHLTKNELKPASRINIVPSEDYQLLQKNIHKVDVINSLANADFDDGFIIETELVVLVGLRIRDILIIAIRGTDGLYDTMTDFMVPRTRGRSIHRLKYHRGFYQGAAGSVAPLAAKLAELRADYRHIYLTGHSLGGGIAAILQALMAPGTEFSRNKYHRMLAPFPAFSCYTFGMPRLGNERAANFQPIYHLAHQTDLIPNVPPAWLGYSDSPGEILLNDPPHVTTIKKSAFGWKRRLALTKDRHSMENYYRSIAGIIGFDIAANFNHW